MKKFGKIFIALATVCLLMCSPIFVQGQPQGYTLVYSPPRAYFGADWMDVKAVYVKEEGEKLYFYIEYYSAMPIETTYYQRGISIDIDSDRNTQTGDKRQIHALGGDYRIFAFYYSGGRPYVKLYRWNSTSEYFSYIKDLQDAKLAPELSYIEIWVDKRDIEFTSNGINFYVSAEAWVNPVPGDKMKLCLNYAVGSWMKEIKVDGEPNDWGEINPLATLPSGTINPPEMEVSSFYVANDGENLYFRCDVSAKPTTTLKEGVLERGFLVYLDIDNKVDTGDTRQRECKIGADFMVIASVKVVADSQISDVAYDRYSGSWQRVTMSSNSSDVNLNSVFEFRVPLKLLELKTGQAIGIAVAPGFWKFIRVIPKTGYLTYPPVKDAVPGLTAISLGEPRYEVGSIIYVSGSTVFNLSASDDVSGVKEVKYRVDGGSWTAYSSGFTLASFNDGEHTISYYSIDNSGNIEAEKTLKVVLDKTPPTISGASPTETASTTQVTFSVKVEDSGSGVREVRLAVDGVSQGLMSQSGSTYTKTLSLPEGTHTWSIEAVDNVGNTITQSYSFTIAVDQSAGTFLSPMIIVIAIAAAITVAVAVVAFKRRKRPSQQS